MASSSLGDSVSAEEDDPSLSSAALCISFVLLGATFRPVFTHQCFQGEWIRGYQPAMTLASNKTHASHRHFDDSLYHLSLVVTLAPSCRACCLEIHVSKKKREICGDTEISCPNAKRVRIENVIDHRGSDTTESTKINTIQNNETPLSAPGDDASTIPMPIQEIIQRLSKGLPDTIVVQEEDKENTIQQQRDDYLSEPMGKIITEYQRKVNGVVMDFVLCVADGQEVADYHSRIQRMALWFIETADGVDLQQKDGGYWKVLYLLCRHEPNKYSLAGYTTLFHFMSPFKKPKPGIVVRICQAMVLPPYQRAGHGKAMLQAVYSDVCDDSQVVEINVEDPAPAFVALRNRVDYELLLGQLQKDKPWIPELKVSFQDEATFFHPLSDAQAVAASVVAKLTPRQVQIAFELHKLSVLAQALENQEAKERVGYETKYRLMVKRRLVKLHREDLGAYNTKQEKQDFLAKAFDRTLAEYRAVLKLKG